jgi:hypothetical protein
VFLALSVLFFFPLASFAQEQSEATQEIGEIILDDDQMINIGIGVIILIIIIAGIVVATRKKSEPQSYKDV